MTRASGTGVVAGLVAVILWPIFAAFQEPFRLLYMAALGVTAFCGLSILWMTISDMMKNPRRGARVVPIRTFDVALGLLLTVPALLTLRSLLA